ncbi:SDR family oxidoreductase [Pyxidicoccus fallax]|uniref:SDR family oxidoreductase n=1 Tax=Pyxidicoccus fallax TaxID=394095 RepID=A0A848M0M1_9BACT|nr:SDR family oxidoreductase [Pyxidicoccus fallax]NMO23666.1 SDR family oxidoreductase [Pyxidicoccus fallax]NPC87078.1 SDR family oxidoreductase [Pyxidicoccus fallax]
MAQKNPDPRNAGPKPPFPEQTQPHPGHEGKMEPQPDYGEKTYKGLGRLTDRVALVTGGDSGIGRAVCLAFAREGADLAVSFLNEGDDANHVKRFVEDAGRQALLLPGDLSVEAHCRKLVEETVKRYGRIDILVNNAAFQGPQVEKFEELDAERVERTFRTNIIAMFHLVRYALPHMKPGGTIINTASIQAYQPSAGILDYATTKGAIVTFTKGLAQHLIERGIRVNSVAPGPVWTPLIPQSFGGEKVKEFGAQSPTGRPAQPAELAPSFVFLASDESRYVNAEILGVTGGQVLA